MSTDRLSREECATRLASATSRLQPFLNVRWRLFVGKVSQDGLSVRHVWRRMSLVRCIGTFARDEGALVTIRVAVGIPYFWRGASGLIGIALVLEAVLCIGLANLPIQMAMAAVWLVAAAVTLWPWNKQADMVIRQLADTCHAELRYIPQDATDATG